MWDAVATGPGISAWFVPNEVEPRAGGASTQRFGGGFDVTGRVTAWEPGKRFAYGSAEPPTGGADFAFDFLVEGRDGGGTVLPVRPERLPRRGLGGRVRQPRPRLGPLLPQPALLPGHFAGRPVQNALTTAFIPGRAAEIWPVPHTALGLAGHPAVGETVTLRPEGPEPITGVLDVASPEFLGVRSAHGLHRIGAEGDAGCGVSAYHYFYGEPVDEEAITAAWQSWLAALFPPAVDTGAL